MGFSAGDLTAIENAMKSGELEVEYGDRRVKYRSIMELTRAYETIKSAVNEPATASSRKAKQVRFAAQRGFGK